MPIKNVQTAFNNKFPQSALLMFKVLLSSENLDFMINDLKVQNVCSVNMPHSQISLYIQIDGMFQ